jgi:SAM-dependent methyltransferase
MDCCLHRTTYGTEGLAKYRHEVTEALFFEHLENSGPRIIVDFGSALGHFTQRIWKYNPQAKVVGVDYQVELVELASKTFPEISFKKGALPQVDFEDDSLDAVFIVEMLYILRQEEQKEALVNIRKALRPGGMLYFSANIRNPLRYYSDTSAKILVGNYFEIVDVKYVYNKIGTVPHKFLGALVSMTDLSGNLDTPIGRRAKVRWALSRLTEIPVLGHLLRAIFALMHSASVSLSGSVNLFRCCGLLTQTFMPKSGATNILIVARKPEC